MSERTSYAPGTPCWVDLGTPDVEGAAAFYAGLLGWEVPELENSEEVGGYRLAKKDGREVAGVMPLMQEGQPPAWTTYLAVEDVDATAAAAREAGGNVLAEPSDVMDLGRMAILADPTGAVFGIWQAGTFAGAELYNEVGAFCWNELETRDPGAAKSFYGTVFGWEFEDHDMGEMGTYTEWKLGGASIGGMADITGRVPEQVPAHWMTYFAVDDADASLAKIDELGGEVRFGPVDIPAGRFAMAADPFGAAFAVIRLAEEAAA
jgi:predicted enzyme related to lactoylglutathione lyase